MKLFFLFQKVTVGDVNIPRPSFFSFEAKTKW
jgi:acyl-CoA-binding protein